MAKLTPDATRTEHGLVINEKIIPWGAVWPKDSGAYKKGAQYKADRLLSGGTGKVKGVTIHNTNDLKNVEEDAEQYAGAVGVHPADHHGKVRLQFRLRQVRLRQVRRRRGEQSEGGLQELPEQRTGQVPRTG